MSFGLSKFVIAFIFCLSMLCSSSYAESRVFLSSFPVEDSTRTRSVEPLFLYCDYKGGGHYDCKPAVYYDQDEYFVRYVTKVLHGIEMNKELPEGYHDAIHPKPIKIKKRLNTDFLM